MARLTEPGIPARRRIGGSYTTFIYDGGISMAIAEVIMGVKATWAAATTAIETRDAVKMNELKLTMSNQLLELYTAAFALHEEKAALADAKRELENEVAQLRQQANRLAQYERMRTPAGAVVFVDKTTMDSTDGAVYACASCMDDGKVSTLQPLHAGRQLRCPVHGDVGLLTEPVRGPIGMLLPKRT